MPNRPNNPKQGWLLPYAIRPLPAEREAAMAAAPPIDASPEGEDADDRADAARRSA